MPDLEGWAAGRSSALEATERRKPGSFNVVMIISKAVAKVKGRRDWTSVRSILFGQEKMRRFANSASGGRTCLGVMFSTFINDA